MKKIKLPYIYKAITGVPLKEQNANGSHPGSNVFVYSKSVHLIWSTYPLKGAKRCCNQPSRELEWTQGHCEPCLCNELNRVWKPQVSASLCWQQTVTLDECLLGHTKQPIMSQTGCPSNMIMAFHASHYTLSIYTLVNWKQTRVYFVLVNPNSARSCKVWLIFWYFSIALMFSAAFFPF